MSTPQRSIMTVLLSEVSEDYYAAGWLNGLEYDLWARVEQFRREERCSPWGAAGWESLTDTVRMLWDAAVMTGTWAMWDEDLGDARPVSLEEWETVHWPAAPQQYRDIANETPYCGDFGPMVRYRNPLNPERAMRLSYFSTCRLPAGHDGEHNYRDRDGEPVTHDRIEPILMHPDAAPAPEVLESMVADEDLTSALLIEAALHSDMPLDDTPAYVWVDPARLTGEPCIGGTRLAVQHVADQYRWFGMDEATSYFEITRPQVLVACWYLATYGYHRHRLPMDAEYYEAGVNVVDDGEIRDWTGWWGQWASEATAALWRRTYAEVPDPPRLPEWNETP